MNRDTGSFRHEMKTGLKRIKYLQDHHQKKERCTIFYYAEIIRKRRIYIVRIHEGG